MNEKLAKAIADVISDKWDPQKGKLHSREIYQELVTRTIEVPEGDMEEIFDQFVKAGLVGGPRPHNTDAFRQHGSMIISSVNLSLLKQLEFD